MLRVISVILFKKFSVPIVQQICGAVVASVKGVLKAAQKKSLVLRPMISKK